jgi:hypothetical protein
MHFYVFHYYANLGMLTGETGTSNPINLRYLILSLDWYLIVFSWFLKFVFRHSLAFESGMQDIAIVVQMLRSDGIGF